MWRRYDYVVDPDRALKFYGAIRRYYPDLPDDSLQADYAGIRPKISGPHDPPEDFVIQVMASNPVDLIFIFIFLYIFWYILILTVVRNY